jgi:hypothetical protein
VPHTVPTPPADERLRRLCAELRSLANSGDLGYYAEHRLRELVDQAQPDNPDWTVMADGSVDFHGLAEAGDGGQAAYETELARLRGETSTHPLMDKVVYSLRVLGATGPAHAEDILAAAGTHLSPRERQHVLNEIADVHAHMPDPAVAGGGQDGTWWVDEGIDPDRVPCGHCGVLLAWTRHPDREQWGWKVVAGDE